MQPSSSVVISAALLLALPGASSTSQSPTPSFHALIREFDYDRTTVDVSETGVEDRLGVKIHNISYPSPRGGRVPAYLVSPPPQTQPVAAILFGHWMMDGSPLKNRNEFLEEAVLLAKAGAISLLIDTPQVRPGFVADPDPLSPQSGHAAVQQAVDFRRGIDLLLARGDVDPERIAYVGHSFDAKVGAMLAGVEKRIRSFVLMAGAFDDNYYVFHSTAPALLKFRHDVGDEKIREYFRNYPWDEPANYARHSAPAAVFLQFGRRDAPIPEEYARHCYELFNNPKRIAFYDSGHALDAAARSDRSEWLVRRLALRPVNPLDLARIPQLH